MSKTEITFEKEEVIVIRAAGLMQERYCPRCLETVEMVAPCVVAFASTHTEREIFRLIEADQVHSIESDILRVCLNCLKKERKSYAFHMP